jgi:hypothetical protein
MNTQALFLFLILLVGLVLCSFLGGSNCSKEGYTNSNNNYNSSYNYNNNSNSYNSNSNNGYNSDEDDTNYNHNYDNYNHYNNSSSQLGASNQLQNGATFTGANGDTAVYTISSSGVPSIQLNQASGSSYIIFNKTPQGPQTPTSSTSSTSSGGAGTKNTFYGPAGSTATIVFSSKGNTIVFNPPNGAPKIIFTQSGTTTNNNNGSISQSAYYGSVGTIMPPSNTYSSYDNSTYGVNAQGSNGGSAGYYNGPNGGSAGYYNTPYGGSGGYISGPMGNTVAASSNNNPYSSSLPPGIPGHMIPSGQEDLYILKSEIVPPVCPACPSSSSCPSSKKEKCPPCPACARCPEPSFECKKVPNYSAMNDEMMPEPILNDFSTFGM